MSPPRSDTTTPKTDRPFKTTADNSREDRPLVLESALPVNCKALWNGDATEIRKAEKFQELWSRKVVPSPPEDSAVTWNCPRVRQYSGHEQIYVSEEELSFPLAFSILVYRDAEQVSGCKSVLIILHFLNPPSPRPCIILYSVCTLTFDLSFYVITYN